MTRHRLDDATWSRMYVVLKALPGIHVRDEITTRRFVEAVVYVLRTGIAWADLPERFGDAAAVRKRFRRWSTRGVWRRLRDAGAPASPETAMIDGTVCKAHRTAAGARRGRRAATGRSRGGLTTKVVAVVDDVGRILRLSVLPGQAGESPAAVPLLAGLGVRRVLADKAYDSRRIRERLLDEGVEPVIPPKRDRREPVMFDRRAYRRRHVVENVFAHLKDNIRIALRRDKTAISYAGFVNLAAALHNQKFVR